MKKIVFVFYLLLVLCQIGTAQRIGIEGGLNISKPAGFRGSTSLFGIHLGPIVEFSLSDKFFVNSGLLYSDKGYRFDVSDLWIGQEPYPGFKDPGTLKIKTGYLEIPVLMSYKLPLEEEGYRLYLQGGPSASYCCTHPELIDSKFDYGIILGFGFEGKCIRAGLNYNMGLKDVWPNIRSRVFQISAAYLFKSKEN